LKPNGALLIGSAALCGALSEGYSELLRDRKRKKEKICGQVRIGKHENEQTL
jgi:hypothetical protein